MKNPPKLPTTKKWKEVLEKEYKFRYINHANKIPKNAIWTTSCSKTKLTGNKGYPTEFYVGRYNLLFYKFMKKHELKFGVISDKYGIHMFDETLKYYDIHPSTLTLKDKLKLGKKISRKIKKYGFKEIVFYYPSPLQSKPYFDILWFSKIPTYYISKIGLLNELNSQ